MNRFLGFLRADMSTPGVRSDRFGLDLPPGFPVAELESIHGHLSDDTVGTGNPYWADYAGAVNGLVYRTIEAWEEDGAFRRSLAADGAGPPQPARLRQEISLFNFFLAGFSAVDCLYYALAFVGAIADPDAFALVANRRAVTVGEVTAAYERIWPDEPLTERLAAVSTSQEFTDWRERRNQLVHRAWPGRHFSAGDGGRPLWLGAALSDQTTAAPFAWLVEAVHEVIVAGDEFTRSRVHASPSTPPASER